MVSHRLYLLHQAREQEYHSRDDVMEDMRRICSNARLYNGKKHFIYDDACK